SVDAGVGEPVSCMQWCHIVSIDSVLMIDTKADEAAKPRGPMGGCLRIQGACKKGHVIQITERGRRRAGRKIPHVYAGCASNPFNVIAYQNACGQLAGYRPKRDRMTIARLASHRVTALELMLLVAIHRVGKK